MKTTYELINEFRGEMNCRFDKIEENFVTKEKAAPYFAAMNLIGVLLLTTIIGGIIYLLSIHPTSLLAK